MRTKNDLRQLQSLPLELKIKLTQRRIRDWVRQSGRDGLYRSLSSGYVRQIRHEVIDDKKDFVIIEMREVKSADKR